MESSQRQLGNNPERWQRLLAALDEKLQLGLLEHLRRVSSYHFEGDLLYLIPCNKAESEYFQKNSVKIQLELLAKDAVQITGIVVQEQ